MYNILACRIYASSTNFQLCTKSLFTFRVLLLGLSLINAPVTDTLWRLDK